MFEIQVKVIRFSFEQLLLTHVLNYQGHFVLQYNELEFQLRPIFVALTYVFFTCISSEF